MLETVHSAAKRLLTKKPSRIVLFSVNSSSSSSSSGSSRSNSNSRTSSCSSCSVSVLLLGAVAAAVLVVAVTAAVDIAVAAAVVVIVNWPVWQSRWCWRSLCGWKVGLFSLLSAPDLDLAWTAVAATPTQPSVSHQFLLFVLLPLRFLLENVKTKSHFSKD